MSDGLRLDGSWHFWPAAGSRDPCYPSTIWRRWHNLCFQGKEVVFADRPLHSMGTGSSGDLGVADLQISALNEIRICTIKLISK